ncbi:hypothetical protein RUM43_013917 [Polyplax serrata]|uniref:AAA+ ATPase domain-containing protein n=1 Tax=Polyplax serrata TaxID=468196 RepID=A0AAN8P504_POLSC
MLLEVWRNAEDEDDFYKCTSAASSRSASPSSTGQFISIPRPTATRNSLTEKQWDSNGLKQTPLNGSRTSLRVPVVNVYGNSQNPSLKNSMIEKFRLFNAKDKSTKTSCGNSKRTSSSSGFSSAKSEHSDSSTSLCSDAKQTRPSDKLESGASTIHQSAVDQTNGSKLKSIRTTKIAKSNCEKKQSSPKLKRMIDIEPKTGKQVVKQDKIREVGDSDPKTALHTEESKQMEQNKLKLMEMDKGEKPKPKCPHKPENVHMYQELPLKVLSSTGIPKPMAAVKGTTKVANGTDVNPAKTKSPSIPRIPLEMDKQKKKDELCIAMVSPIRTSLSEDTKRNGEQKTIIGESDKRLKDVEEEEVMNVKPMSPLMNGYRLGSHSSVHFTHTTCNGQVPKNIYYAQAKTNSNLINLESIDLAMDDEVLKNMNKANLMQDVNSGYVSDSYYSKRQDERSITNGTPIIKTKGSSETTFGIVQKPKIPNGKNLNTGELSSDQDYFDETKGLVSSSPNQWPSQGEFHQSPVTYRTGTSRSSGRKSESSQQTEGSAFRPIQSNVWKKYPLEDPNKADDLRTRERKSPISNGTGRKSKSSKGLLMKEETGAKQNGTEGKTKVKGVPSSFGYVKRNTNGATVAAKSEARTAQVSAVPRTKVKVSGGTQTTSDLTHFKSYSLTGTSANQLSQCVRERLLGSQSLPKSGSNDYAALFHQHRSPHQQRQHKATDGSLSDTAYSNYSEIHNYYANNSPYSSWLRSSSTYTASLPSRTSTGLADAESLESISSLPVQLQHRASLTHTRALMNQREGSASPGHRLNRSNSIRSTKSEKLYPSMLQRSDETEAYYGIPVNSMASKHSHASQPTSPTPSQLSQGIPSRYNYPLSPISSSTSSHGLNRGNLSIYNPGNLSKVTSNDEDIHGSSISLVSTASSLYSTPEEKQAHEIRKLRRELLDSQEKVYTLTSQLSTNAHVVSAFEQSLSSMTQRLQHLTATTEKKDQELLELRKNIEMLRKQGREFENGTSNPPPGTPCLSRRHQSNTDEIITNGAGTMTRQLSTDSVSSLNSLSSACSISSSANCSNSNKGKKKKKGWLRSSFSKAFSRSRKNKNGSVSDVEDFRRLQTDHDVVHTEDLSAPSSPLLNNHVLNISSQNLKISHSSSALCKQNEGNEEMSECDLVEDLKKQLREKDLVLTDIRLEALSSAHQLESLKDTVIKMRNELLNLKQDNERLQRIVTSKSLTSSQSSVNHLGSVDRRFSLHENSLTSLSNGFAQDSDGGKRTLISVLLGSHGVFHKYVEDNCRSETVIAAIYVSPKTQWDMLDSMVRKMFKDYVHTLDPATSLGLSSESIWSYHIGEVVRYKDSSPPDLLPYAYLVEEEDTLRICLKGAMHNGSLDAIAFETLIPKSIIQRYISLLTEHRRIILCGPSGTGKSYLANKLSEFLVSKTGKESTAESIATFNVDHKNSKELRQYLTNVAEQCETNASDLPSVIILDNLHQAASLAEVFNGFLSSKYSKCPFIIGTMNQATCSTTNLQLHHNFRWILCANHMEPVKGFLSRYLRRRTIDGELREGTHNNDMARVIDWIPKVWHHLNKFIEMHNSSDVTLGPRLFLVCPDTVENSRVWFTDLWNYAIVPYLMDAVREGLQLYGKRTAWEDPTQFVFDTYPWADDMGQGGPEALLRIRPEDIGFDINGSSEGTRSVPKTASNQSESEGDPLLNMLMRLQEAANYTRGQVNGNNLSETGQIPEVIPEIMETSKASESCI